MSPAATLRDAAKVLRDTASNATPGPWKTKGVGDFGWLVVDADPAGRFSVETEDNEHGRADAAWIALAHPGLAEPLAAWLEIAADDLGGAAAYLARTAASSPPGEVFDPFDYVDEPDSVRAAMDIARAILGRDS